MCGICGQVVFDERVAPDSGIVKNMLTAMHHRGPDDEGIYVSPTAVLGHKRLSIIDLSRGAQPIANETNTVWIVFNGEIYNYKDLRRDLAGRGHTFRTDTDTEVIVHLYEEYGEECLQKLQGMFAFAIWDDRRRKLFLARDRVGIKPVYYSCNGKRLIFASEIKALTADPSLRREVDPDGIDLFLTFNYMPGEKTLLRNVFKLNAGHYLVAENGKISIQQYWDLAFETPPPEDGLARKTAELAELLRQTVRDHMISDVPVGVLLSGGVDSTALLSFAHDHSATQVDTFTVGFDDRTVTDERPFARIAAKTFAANHHEMSISAQDFLEFLPQYVWHMEEPVCEPPAVALYYVSRLASQRVKVLLSGEGGDEAFAGYQNYRNVMWLERAKRAGWPVTRALAFLLARAGRWGRSQRARKYSDLMKAPLSAHYFSRTWSPLNRFSRLTGDSGSKPGSRVPSPASASLIKSLFEKVADQSPLNQMLYVDSKTWLPDDLLVKADKMTMANSVELRVPFLDHKVLEFAARLPESAKIRGLTTKRILKRAFEGRIPQAILNRPKTGFPVPYESWFRGELRAPLWDLLQDRKTRERGYFEPSRVDMLLNDSTRNGGSASEIFSLVTLELWHRKFVDATP